MKLFGYNKNDRCKLCGKSQCTLHHIISNCAVSLDGKRYMWRHDSVLANIEKVLRPHIDKWNENHKLSDVPHISKSFTSAGKVKKGVKLPRPSFLDGVNDWELLVDYDHAQIVFPPEIYSTPERPDIVIWSKSKKTVLLIELTCPAEEGIEAAQIRKEARYSKLIAKFPSAWRKNAKLMTIEVGARGFIAHSVGKCLNNIGFNNRLKNKLCKTLSLVCVKCTYTIYLAATSNAWTQKDLLVLED